MNYFQTNQSFIPSSVSALRGSYRGCKRPGWCAVVCGFWRASLHRRSLVMSPCDFRFASKQLSSCACLQKSALNRAPCSFLELCPFFGAGFFWNIVFVVLRARRGTSDSFICGKRGIWWTLLNMVHVLFGEKSSMCSRGVALSLLSLSLRCGVDLISLPQPFCACQICLVVGSVTFEINNPSTVSALWACHVTVVVRRSCKILS